MKNKLPGLLLLKLFRGSLFYLLIALTILSLNLYGQVPPVITCSVSAGVKTIPGTYATITAAVSAMQANGIAGPVILELQPSYSSASETFPITLGSIPCASSTNTITIRPAAGTGALITSTNSASTIDFNGGNYWIIDGRSGGTGNIPSLLISNTGGGSGSSALRFINDGSNNLVWYTSFVGTGSSALSGVISFIGSPTSGNSNNIIYNCSIDGNADGLSSPTTNVSRNGIYSLGNATVYNSNNTVLNCKIFNWFLASTSTTSSGIFLSTGNTGWTIQGNSFYQTSPRVFTSGTNPLIAINISDITGTNFNVLGNYIGGRAQFCSGSAWTQSGVDNQFIGISINAGFTTPTTVDGNVIQNISTSTTYFEPFYGIKCTSGDVNIGLNSGNVIGNAGGTGSINILSGNTTSSGGNSRGIAVMPTGNYGTSTIRNNTIGSITLAGTSSLAKHSFTGIFCYSMIAYISGNLIGAENTPNSIYASNTAAGSTNQQVVGILSSTPGVSSIYYNVVANLKNAFTTSASSFTTMRGIVAFGRTNIYNNVVRDLYTVNNSTGTGVNSSVIGIQYQNDDAWNDLLYVYANKVYSLSNSNATAAVSVTGIFYDGQVSNGTIELNSVFALSASSAAATINGIYASGGLASYANNMISLGIDTFGNQLTTPCKINGILDSLDGNSFYHNTVYIGGSGVGSTANNTFAFSSTVTTTARDIRDNIFINARSNTSAGGKHYAIQVAGTAPNPAGLTLDYNIYQATGTGGVFGRFNSGDVLSLTSWRTAVGKDANSISASPCLSNPTAGWNDLHLTVCFGSVNPADGTGVLIPSVTQDFDGEIRSALTPTDIGADAGLYGPVTLGNYPSSTVVASDNIIVTPDAPPIGAVYLSATTSSSFTGVLTADPVTGAVQIINAKPAGTYTIKVTANGLTVRTFNLTVTNTLCSVGTFSDYSTFGYGTLGNPYFIAVGDFNKDGNQDMARANYIGQFECLLGDGLGNFDSGLAESAGSSPTSIAIGDVNSDGNEDILVTNSGGNTVSLRLGDGTGNFNFSPDIFVGNAPYCVAVGDFNNDAKQDFVTANANSNNVSVMIGTGTGGFAPITSVSVGTSPRYVVVGDFNNDGNQDIATANYNSSNVSIRLGNGTGAFSGTTNVAVGSQPVSIALGDFNSDGNQDLIVTNFGSNTASVLLGTGSGSFTSGTTLTTGSQPMFVSVGDFNSDGKQDVVVANSGSGNVFTYLGNGSGGFGSSSATPMGANPFCVVVCDLNNDGIQDLLSSSHSTGTLDFKLGDFKSIVVGGSSGGLIPNGSTTISYADGTYLGNVSSGGSATNVVSLYNSGTLPLNISNIYFSPPGEFSVSSPATPITLNPLSLSVPLFITFTPSAPGLRSTTIHIISDDCINGDYSFALQGKGCFPGDTNSIHISSNGLDVPSGGPNSISNNTDFGSVVAGNSVSKTFTITNFGTDPVALNSFYFYCNSPSEFHYTGTIPDTLQPSSSTTFTVTFSPSSYDDILTAYIYIYNGYCVNSNYSFTITGTAICYPTAITSCPGNQNVLAGTNSCQAIVNYTVTSSFTTDTLYYEFTGATMDAGPGTGSGSIFNNGITHVKVTAANVCSADICNFDVTVTPNINDNDACTIDACDSTTGTATHTAVNINDNNACTTDACNSIDGSITHTPVNISDNNVCTTDDGCNTVTGTITNTLININDNNICTNDACDPITGPSHIPINFTDQNACTIDACNSATSVVTHTLIDISDNNACTIDACISTTGSITHIALIINDNNACTTDACNTSTGSITHTAVIISDSDACTTDACNTATGSITHTAINLSDNNACTTDACNTTNGTITHTAIFINDNNACTTDACNTATGSITHTAINISDNNACTTDACNTANQSITHTGVETNDNNACTTDACNTATGSITHTAINLSDNNACTTDACDTTTGSVTHTAIDINDNNVCTTDACISTTGSVIHTSIDINDNNVCTTDACDPITGTSHTPINIDDNNVCTTDACDPLSGTSHTPISFDDNNACTTDACDPLTGTSHTSVNIDDNNVCTTDACNSHTGAITNILIDFDDNNDCTNDYCDPVTGPFHIPINIDDNNACTVDACNSVNGRISHTANNINDNDACTSDACNSVTGTITHTIININDNNACTADACNSIFGTSHTPINFDDNNICTTDACDPITGTSHTPINYDDNNVCTTDACDPITGTISHFPISKIINNDTTICPGSTISLSATGNNSINQICSLSNFPSNLQIGLVGYYPFCGNANDESGNGNNGTVIGATLTNDKNGNPLSAYSFDGVDDKITIGNSFNFTTQTISVWARSSISSSFCDPCHVLFSKIGNPNTHLDCELRGPNLFLFGDGNNYNILVFNSNQLSLGDWYHVVVTYDFVLQQASFYLNGLYQGSVSGNLQITLNQNAVIGARTSNSLGDLFFNGVIDDVKIYDRVLSAVEVLQLYNQNTTTFLWSNGETTSNINVSPSQTTTYYCTVTQNGQSCLDSVKITVLVTDDNNVCTTDACDPITGTSHTTINYDDNNVCTTDACDPITGTSHTPINYDDNNVCTTDACDPIKGTSHTTINYDDNNVCTNDACDPITGTSHTPINYDDNNVCTTDACDPVTGTSHSINSVDDNNICTTDACDPVTGTSHTPINFDDNNVCTTDACDPISGTSHTPINYDDNNVCTTDACDPISGTSHTIINYDDDNFCTTDICDPITGTSHTTINYDDSNVCTTDACDPITGTSHTTINYDDNNVCTTDACDSITGTSHTLNNYDDNNVCTTDACDPVTGTSHTLNNVDDNNVCTTDACDPVTGTSHTPIDYDDSNICTTDACDPITGTFHTTINYDDNNVCTTDACDPVTGTSHTFIDFDDSNPCTRDGCNAISGEFHLPLTNTGFGTADDLLCTQDNCDNGTTVHPPVETTDNDACTVDACNTSNGSITHTPLSSISDDNACTHDVCDPATGTTSHEALATIDDSNACTLDVCNTENGTTSHTPLTTITDNNPCTIDACDSTNGSITHTDDSTDIVLAAGNILCNGETTCIGVSATGGTPPYTGTGTFCGYGAGTWTFTIRDGKGCSVAADATITEPSKVTVPAPTFICSGGQGVATAAPVGGTGAYNYLWGPATLMDQTTNPATNLGNGVYTVKVTDANGCSATSSTFTVNCAVVCPTVGIISGPAYVCKGSTVTYSVPALPGQTFVWTLPTGMTVVGPTSGNSITVSIGSHISSSGGYICARTTCVGSNTVCLQVKKAKNNPNTPGTISGPYALCPATCATYSVVAVPYATGYNWTATGGLTISSGQGTNTVVVCAPANYTGNGDIKVRAVNCKGPSGTRTKSSIKGGATVAWHASHTNENATVACAGSTVAYEVTSPGMGGSVTFTASGGAIVSDRRGNSGNTLTITQPDPNEGEWEVDVQFPNNFISGNVTVTPNNSCGAGTSITLSVQSNPSAPAVITGSSSVCKHSTVCYSIAASQGATSYTWTVSGGAQIQNGQGTTNVCIKFNNSTVSTAVLSVVANNSCGTSGAATKTISINTSCKVNAEVEGTQTDIKYVISSLTVYPNPTMGKTMIAFHSVHAVKYNLRVTDMIGKVMMSESVTSEEGYNEKAISLENAAKGIYILTIEIEGVEAGKLKIVVE